MNTAPRPLLPLEEAVARLVAGTVPHAFGPDRAEAVPAMEARGRVLAADIASTLAVPPEDNSAMDGYALRAADVPAAGTVLPVSQRIPAGVVGAPLAPGTAARIFTGAQVPAGADAVVMQEQCEALAEEGSPLGRVRVNAVPAPGTAIRRRGEDVPLGSLVLARGRRLDPAALGLAASVGHGTLPCAPRPRVALFSTGDELRMPGEPLPPGAIYNSNRFTLRALVEAAGGAVIDLGIVPDRLDATRAALREAALASDIVVTCGGVSVGEEDHLKPAVAVEGALEHWQLAIKPGKPLAFGHVRRGDGSAALFIGLPGNPVSAFVTWLLCGAPVLRVLQGAPAAGPLPIPLRADFDWPRPDRRREFLRVKLNAAGGLDLYPNQGSGVLTSVVWADGLVDIPPSTAVRRGDTVAFLPLAALLAG
jgi:molybdopterin molybdotransferase